VTNTSQRQEEQEAQLLLRKSSYSLGTSVRGRQRICYSNTETLSEHFKHGHWATFTTRPT